MRPDCRTGLAVCPCAGGELVALLDAALFRAHTMADADVEGPATWSGSMRREDLRYGTETEKDRYQGAFDTLARARTGWAPLSVAAVQNLHALGVGNGVLRREQLWIAEGHTFPHPSNVPLMLNDLCEGFEERRKDASTYSAALDLHLGMLIIHPFTDGNGRLSRLVAARELMRSGYCSRVFTVIDQHFGLRPRIYTDLLTAYDEGWICRATCLGGMLFAAVARCRMAQCVPQGDSAVAEAWAMMGERQAGLLAPIQHQLAVGERRWSG